ncbi:MAG TPA: DUF6585 family protein [Ktedonobacterales bacterium]
MSQQTLPPEAYSYAGMYQLGQPVAVYRAAFRNSITMGIICVLLGALFGAVAISGDSSGPSILLMLFLALLCVAGVVYYLVYYPLVQGSWRIYGCADGLVLLKKNNAVACRWDQIAFVWQHIVTYYSYGIRTGTSFKYTIQRTDGVKIVITQTFRNVSQLGAQVQREVTSRLAPQALAAVRAGQTLPFGPFSLSGQGLATPREMIPWSEAPQVSASRGLVMVQRRGQRRGKSYGKVSAVPNVYVFLSVVEALTKAQPR